MTHLLELLDKMCKYEMDPTSIVEDTEQTPFCLQTDRRTDGRTDGRKDGKTDKVKPLYPLFNFVEAGGIMSTAKQNTIKPCTYAVEQTVNASFLAYTAPTSFFMMTPSKRNIFRFTGPLCGEFTGHWWIPPQRPVTQSFAVFFYLFIMTSM